MTDVASPPAEAPPEPKPNTLQRIVGVLTAPDETFQAIARRPNWVTPLLIVLVLSIVSTVLMMPHIDFEGSLREAMEAQGRPVDAQALKFVVAFTKALTWFSPLLGLVVLLIVAGIFLLAFRIFGGEGEYAQALSIVVYAWVPQLIRSIIALIVLLSRSSISLTDLQEPIRSNLSFLFNMKTQPLMFALSGSFDVFTFWTLFLLTVGFAHMSRFSKARAALIVLAVWVFGTLLKLIGPAIAQARVGSGS